MYDLNGRFQYSDSGYWFRELDRNAEKTIDSLVAPETPVEQEKIPHCEDLPFCGLPSYSCRQLHTGYFTFHIAIQFYMADFVLYVEHFQWILATSNISNHQ